MKIDPKSNGKYEENVLNAYNEILIELTSFDAK